MRDTDLGWMTKIIAATGGPVSTLADLNGRTLALGSRDSGHAAILPVYFLEQHGMREGLDYNALRFDSDVGKHGDTGTSEVEVMRAVLDGRADAGAVGNRFWNSVQKGRLAPEGALHEIWSSPEYSHCMFTARPDFDPEQERRFTEALFGMSYEDPVHRPILEAEGLKRWLAPDVDGYAELRQAAARQGFFEQQVARAVTRS
jgi:ABC-type phosphate/phosphonate transport system substrate-binding protein